MFFKKSILFKVGPFVLYAFIFSLKTNAQVGVICSKQNIVYVGMDNPLNIVGAEVKCSDLLVTVDKGALEQDEGMCNYNFKINEPGAVIIKIALKSNPNKVIGLQHLRAKNIPEPTIKIGNYENTIPKKLLKAQLGLLASLNGFDFETHFQIVSFDLLLLKNNNRFYKLHNETAVFSKEIINEFREISSGESIMIKDAKVKYPNGKVVTLKPAFFEVVE